MADIFSKEKRSEIMRNVKSNRNKSTELKILKFFKENNITGWRRNFKLLGKPDLVFPKKRLAIFLDGCFWHGHSCRNTQPKDNSEYWTNKIERNQLRDLKVTTELSNKNWNVLRIWECELKHSDKVKSIIEQYWL